MEAVASWPRGGAAGTPVVTTSCSGQGDRVNTFGMGKERGALPLSHWMVSGILGSEGVKYRSIHSFSLMWLTQWFARFTQSANGTDRDDDAVKRTD